MLWGARSASAMTVLPHPMGGKAFILLREPVPHDHMPPTIYSIQLNAKFALSAPFVTGHIRRPCHAVVRALLAP